jgi:hypothetical protein
MIELSRLQRGNSCFGLMPMNQITITQPLTSQLAELNSPVEMVDEFGRALGHFVPRSAPVVDDCPFGDDELKAMQSEQGGRELSEIWKSLRAK